MLVQTFNLAEKSIALSTMVVEHAMALVFLMLMLRHFCVEAFMTYRTDEEVPFGQLMLLQT